MAFPSATYSGWFFKKSGSNIRSASVPGKVAGRNTFRGLPQCFDGGPVLVHRDSKG